MPHAVLGWVDTKLTRHSLSPQGPSKAVETENQKDNYNTGGAMDYRNYSLCLPPPSSLRQFLPSPF